MSNQPAFDPLNPTPEEEEQMLAGYQAGVRGYIPPLDTQFAYAHGYRMARNDMAGVADDDQRELAKRLLEQNERRAAEIRKDAEERRQRLRGALREPAKEVLRAAARQKGWMG